jgi:hypothetical protein
LSYTESDPAVLCPVLSTNYLYWSIRFGLFFEFVMSLSCFMSCVCVYTCVCAFCPVLHYSILLDGDSVCAARYGM